MTKEEALTKAKLHEGMVKEDYYFPPNNILAKVIKIEPYEFEVNNFEVLVTGKKESLICFANIENQGLIKPK